MLWQKLEQRMDNKVVSRVREVQSLPRMVRVWYFWVLLNTYLFYMSSWRMQRWKGV